jgi:hypothetical protein
MLREKIAFKSYVLAWIRIRNRIRIELIQIHNPASFQLFTDTYLGFGFSKIVEILSYSDPHHWFQIPYSVRYRYTVVLVKSPTHSKFLWVHMCIVRRFCSCICQLEYIYRNLACCIARAAKKLSISYSERERGTFSQTFTHILSLYICSKEFVLHSMDLDAGKNDSWSIGEDR